MTDSINTAFVDMTQQLDNGPTEIVRAANDAGVPTGAGWDENNRIALGTAEASPVNMAAAFATLANDGTYIAPHTVVEVKDAQGNVIYTADPTTKQAISQDDARRVNSAMETVVEDGTGTTIDTGGRTVAGKTGTGAVTGKTISSWLVAYTRQISTAVMFVAGDDGAGDLDAYRQPGSAWFYSSGYPADVWSDYMRVAMKGLPNLDFESAPDSRPSRTSSVDETWRPSPTSTTPSAAPTETQSTEPSPTETSEPPESPEPTGQPTQPTTPPEPTGQPTIQPPKPTPSATP